MANYCENYLVVEGSKEALKEWKDALVNSDVDEAVLSFNKLIPLPEEEKDNWYEWRIQNWGTRSDITGMDDAGVFPEEYSDEYKYVYEFHTAWSPPTEWLKAVGIMFPDLSFRMEYSEPGACFAGIITVQGDEVDDFFTADSPRKVHEFMLEYFGYSHWDEEDLKGYEEE